MPKLASKQMTVADLEAMQLSLRDGFVEVPDGMVRALLWKISNRAITAKLCYKGRRYNVAKLKGGEEEFERIRLIAQRARRSGNPPKHLREQDASGKTLKTIAETYIARGLVVRRGPNKGEPLRSASDIEKRIRKRLISVWGDRPITELTASDATELLDRVGDEAGPDAARTLYQNLQSMMRWTVKRDTIKANPFEVLDQPAGNPDRDRVLDNDELRAIWLGTLALNEPAYGAFIRLLIATGARRREISDLHRREIQDGWIVLPPARSKNKVEFRIPICGLIESEIDALKSGGYLLSTMDGEKAINGFAKIKRYIDQASGVENWRFHDIRRTVRSNLAALNVTEEVAERILHHLPASKMTRTYNRYRYDRQVRAALTKWHKKIREITAPPVTGNVVRLAR